LQATAFRFTAKSPTRSLASMFCFGCETTRACAKQTLPGDKCAMEEHRGGSVCFVNYFYEVAGSFLWFSVENQNPT